MQFRHSVLIKASADRVWSTLSDITRWPDWTPTVKKVRRLDGSVVGVGSRFKLYQPKLLPAEWIITGWEPGSGFEWVSKAPGVVTAARHKLISSASGVELQLILEFTGALSGLVGRLAGKLTQEYLALEAAGLKRHCEDAEGRSSESICS